MRGSSLLGLAGRWLLLVWGMLVATAGIVFITRAGLGTTPISTVPFTVGEITGLTFGEATFAVNILFVLVQWALLRSRFHYSSFCELSTGRFPVSGLGSAGFAAPTSSERIMVRGVPPLPCPSLDSPFLRMRKRRFCSLDFCWSSKICFTARDAMFIAAT